MNRRKSMASGMSILALALVAVGCDEREQRDAARKAGEGMEKTVNVVSDAARDATHAAGGVMERAGDKVQDVTDRDPATRPVAPTTP